MPISLTRSAHIKPFQIRDGRNLVRVAEWGLRATTTIGVLRKLNLLHWRTQDTNACGFANGFGRTSDGEYFVLVRVCKRSDVQYGWNRSNELGVVSFTRILLIPMYVRLNALIRPEFAAWKIVKHIENAWSDF